MDPKYDIFFVFCQIVYFLNIVIAILDFFAIVLHIVIALPNKVLLITVSKGNLIAVVGSDNYSEREQLRKKIKSEEKSPI